VIKETIFSISGTPIKTVATFKYLGGILEKNDDDWPVVCGAINPAQMEWCQLQKLLTNYKVDPKNYDINIQGHGSSSFIIWG
jgi:hypothetical protein